MKKALLLLLAFAAGMPFAQAQMIDFDMTGRNTTEVTEDDYTAWPVTQGPGETKDFEGGVSITVAAAANADMLRSQWSKNDVKSSQMKLIGDGVAAFIADGNNTPNQTDQVLAITVTITGLSAGTHTVQAYHNGVNGYKNLAPIDVFLNGTLVEERVKQSENVTNLESAGLSYLTFNAVEGQPTVITYQTHLEPGATYGSSLVYLNALIFNKSNTLTQAQSPVPASGDFHVDADQGSATLSWTPASGAVKHHVYFGTQADALTRVATVSGNSHDVGGLSNLSTYYWRIDEEDAQGTVTQGETWNFRPRHLAFPGAEGYGRYAIGGRGGSVYHVTTLDDNGDDENPLPGSFRYGIKKATGPRTIVFDVAGVISLKSRLTCSDPYVTIAGQTAPGNGIMLRTCPFGMASDGITRFIRMRLGHKKLVNGVIPGANNGEDYGTEKGTSEETTVNGVDGMGMAGNNHAIMDHCSISWTIDEAFSSRGAQSMTLQRTLISEALNVAGHPNYSAGKGHGFAATIGGGEMSTALTVGSYHHNLLAHNSGRNWSISGGLDGAGYYDGHHDIFNNVVYNWNGRTTDGGSHEINFVNNFYKEGPACGNHKLFTLQLEGTGKGTQSAYVSGNIRQNYAGGSLTEDKQGTTYTYALSGGQQLDWEPFASQPYFESLATIETAKAAYKNVLSDVGCALPLLDNHDQRMVGETLAGTSTTKGSRSGLKGLIDSEEDNGCEGFGGLNIVTVSRDSDWDTDQDGMPDWWEEAKGLNPAGADNNDDPDGDGYTNLEDYLNWLAEPHFIVESGQTLTISLRDFFAGYNNQPSFEILPEGTGKVKMTPAWDRGELTVAENGDSFATILVKASDQDGWGTLTRPFNLFFKGVANGISELKAPAQPQTEEPWYNLQGQRTERPAHGVFIHKGKKVVVK